jgi:nitrogen regulatory protein PII-like uncharacterized protein
MGNAVSTAGYVILTVFYHYRYRRMSPEKWIREATAGEGKAHWYCRGCISLISVP